MNPSKIALGLSIFTAAYNVLEGVVSVVISRLEGSSALLGFGIDSFMESFSGLVMIWRFGKTSGAEHREPAAAKLVAVSFLVLAVYVTYEAMEALIGIQQVGRSPAGLIIAAASLLVMPGLFWAKRRTARRLGSRSLEADAKQTMACMLLSITLLIGSGVNYWTGIPQADSVAALFIAAFLFKEGCEALTTKSACVC